MEKICKNCKTLFSSAHYDAKFCSAKCRDAHFYRNNKDYFKKHWDNYYKAHKEELLKKSRQRYFDWKKNNYKELREINNKAQSKKRFGVLDRKSILEKFNNKCCCCGTSKKLVVHHIDGNGRGKIPNNHPNNLEVLCSSCHKREHNNRRFHGKSTRYSPTL